MSVLRKRSPWVLTAGALLGTLSLGLAGCGGDDDTPFPPVGGIESFNVPPLTPQQAQAITSIAAGQGGTIRATNLDPAVTGGVTEVVVTLPVGTSGEAQTFGVAVLPANQGSINQLKQSNPNALGGEIRFMNPIAEYVVGPVQSNGTIAHDNAPNVAVDTELELSEAQSNFIRNLLNNNQVLDVFRVQNGVASLDPGCFVTPPPHSQGRGRVKVHCPPGRTIVTGRPRQHRQGGGQ